MKAIYVYKAPQDFAIAEKVAEFLDTRRIPTFKRNSTFFLSNSWYLLFICGSWHICIDNEAKSRISHLSRNFVEKSPNRGIRPFLVEIGTW